MNLSSRKRRDPWYRSWTPTRRQAACLPSPTAAYEVTRTDYRKSLNTHLNDAVDFLHLVHAEWPDRGAADHGSGDDVKSGAVTLTHDRLPNEQTRRKRA